MRFENLLNGQYKFSGIAFYKSWVQVADKRTTQCRIFVCY